MRRLNLSKGYLDVGVCVDGLSRDAARSGTVTSVNNASGEGERRVTRELNELLTTTVLSLIACVEKAPRGYTWYLHRRTRDRVG